MITIELTPGEARILKAMMQNPMADNEPGDVAAVRRMVFESIPSFEQLAQIAAVLRQRSVTAEQPHNPHDEN